MIEDDGPPLISKILPTLWQGGTDDELTTYRGHKRLPTISDPRPFDAVVTLCAYTLPVGWLVKELRYAITDGPIEPQTYSEIERVADWAFTEWKLGKKLLIRCQAGLNRSSLVTSLVLMRDGWAAEDVIALIRKQRSEYCLGNEHFVKYIESWVKG